MVLFKRKPVQYVPPPIGLKDDQEIWVIEETDEVFTSYEEYLERMDFYYQTRFICEVTGLSGLDFFQALKREEEAANEVNEAFPEHLREPVLRRAQHSTISRIDNLVDWVFDQFKHDFFPGEMVVVTVDDPNQGRLHGQVREKVKFSAQVDTSGKIIKEAFSRYFVVLTDRPDAEALVDDAHIWRDRKIFSKQLLRSYLRNSLTRESWTGAPWQIKEKLAQQYRIDTEIPPHLRYDAALIQRKMRVAEGKDPNGSATDFTSAVDTSFEAKPKGPKAKKNAQIYDRERQERSKLFEKTFAGDLSLTNFQRNGKVSHTQALHYVNGDIREKEVPSEPPPPPIKYPREDLDNPVSKNVRPSLKKLQDAIPDLRSSTVGELLEVWDFLNVYEEIFVLDSFVFDDFVDALRYSEDDVDSELLVEVHCAVLKKLVNDEKDLNGKVQIELPAEDIEEEDEEEEEEEEEEKSTPMPEPEFKRTTRRSLAQAEAQEAEAQAIIDAKVHLGAEIDRCVPDQDWKVRLRKRNFAHGMWVVIVVGLLNLFSQKPRFASRCEALLARLAPPDMPATEETAISQYKILDINEKVAVLQFLTMLSMETRAVKDYIDDCSLTMTKHRKDKVEYQKKRKEHMAELKVLDEEYRNLLPSAAPAQDVVELAQDLEDTEMIDEEEDATAADKSMADDQDATDDDIIPSRSLRRAKDRESERKKRMEEERKRREEAKAEKAKRPSKEARELEKLLKKIDKVKGLIKACESSIAVCDEDIRQNDIPRLKSLGKDRFYNRYYWFERNAMPYGGMPNASTSHAEYMNGCVWVQGPDAMEREGFIDLRDNENRHYAAIHGWTMPERKAMEEGGTSLHDLRDWGFYDSPEDLDNLLGWLSDKGDRECKLKKEIASQREQICINMEKRQAYLSPDTRGSESAEPATRISTRTRTYVDPNGHRFMKWHNSIALEKQGYIHSDPPRTTTRRGLTKGVKRKSEEKEEIPAKRGRGRPPKAAAIAESMAPTTTRRGTRYGK